MFTEKCGQIQKSCMPETEVTYSKKKKKKNSKYEILDHLYFSPNFVF